MIKEKLKSMDLKKINLKNLKKTIIKYCSTNRLFLTFVLFNVIEGILLRYYTVGNAFSFSPLMCDLAMSFVIGAFGYLFKVKRQFLYFLVFKLIITLICIINTVYFVFYLSFASFGMISSLVGIGEVGDSVVEKLQLYQFIYLIFPILFCILHYRLKHKNYYQYVSKIEKGKRMFMGSLMATVVFVCLIANTMSSSDYGTISKQWNREYLVKKFGIIFYQTNDFFQNLSPKISSFFGYDEAARNFREFYETKEVDETNKYTDIFEGKNVIFVHMESIQSFVLDLEINGNEVSPNINQLADEGLYFNNFYPQISVGTSSDTEFTILTGLMPALSGTVFNSYCDSLYISTASILKDMGYYTFSMHGNNASMWNRKIMHEKLGYSRFYSQEDFIIDETVGLGLSDKSFFNQIKSILEEIEDNNKNYMGTIITLSNHSPFSDLTKYGEFDLTYTYKQLNEETNKKDEVTVDYLEGTKMGNYLKSVHYADEALGEFIEYVENSSYFDDTIFVFYGDHEAKLNKSQFNYLYNYQPETDTYLTEDDEGYVDYDYYAQELNKNTPLIIWGKNNKLNQIISYPMGMYDVMPTIGNMFGFETEYALGHDIFSIRNNNIVIFPNGNFLTSKVYYNNSKDEYLVFDGQVLDSEYITTYKEYTEERLSLSNDIIVYDLIRNEQTSLEAEGS